MDFWVKDQTKSIILKADTFVLNDDGDTIFTISHDGKVRLGKYSKERALEVMDEIHKHINSLISNSAYGVRGWFYQMPENDVVKEDKTECGKQ